MALSNRTDSPTLVISPEDLPFWMRQATRGWDWGLLLTLAFAVVAAWPFILQPGLPRTTPIENHIFMAQDFADALREGRLYPRWSPHVFSGYGAPIPNFYPPGAAYLTAVIKVLFTNDVILAARIVYIAAFIVAGVGVFTLVSRRTGAAAALLASVLYLYSPYLAHTAPHVRGDLPAVVALALLPVLLSLVDRLLARNQPQDTLFVALTLCALAFTHIPLTIVGLVLALTLIAYHSWLRGRSIPWFAASSALILGIGMAAVFWLPAYIEQNAITWQLPSLIQPPRLSIPELFLPLRPIDLAELAPAPQFKLGFVLLGFSLGSLFAISLVRRGMSFYVIFLVLGVGLIAAGVALFPTETSLLGAGILCLALGGSGVVALRERLSKLRQPLVLPVLMTLILAGSVYAWLPPRWSATFGGTTPFDQILYEEQGSGVAVLPPDAPVPTTLSPSLAANRFLITGYQSGNVNKIATARGASNRIINVVSHATHGDRFQIQLDANTRLDALTAYFPGWEASANTAPVRLSRNSQTGLIAIDAPRMNGELAISYNGTLTQRYAWWVSWGALMLAVVLTLRRFRSNRGVRDMPAVLSREESRLMLVVFGCFAGVILLAAAPFAPITLYPRPGYALDNAVAVRNRSDTGLEALAYRVDSFRHQAGDTLNLTLYWQAVRTLPDNYRVQVYLLDPTAGIRWHRTDYTTPGHYPTRRWRTYAYVTDTYQIALSETIVPGDYQIAVEVFTCNPTCDPDQRLTFYNASGVSVGPMIILPAIVTITR